jgi:hypothetical protein
MVKIKIMFRLKGDKPSSLFGLMEIILHHGLDHGRKFFIMVWIKGDNFSLSLRSREIILHHSKDQGR